MKFTFMVLLACALAASVVKADFNQPFTLTTTLGATYRGCHIIKVTNEAITVVHDKGVSKVGFDVLSREWITKFRHDFAEGLQQAEIEAAGRDQTVETETAALEAWERAEEERLAALMEFELKRIAAERARLEAFAAVGGGAPTDQAAPLLIPLPGHEAMLAVVTESVVPLLPPISQVYTPAVSILRSYRSGRGLYSYGAAYPAFAPVYIHPGHYHRRMVCPPFIRHGPVWR